MGSEEYSELSAMKAQHEAGIAADEILDYITAEDGNVHEIQLGNGNTVYASDVGYNVYKNPKVIPTQFKGTDIMGESALYSTSEIQKVEINSRGDAKEALVQDAMNDYAGKVELQKQQDTQRNDYTNTKSYEKGDIASYDGREVEVLSNSILGSIATRFIVLAKKP